MHNYSFNTENQIVQVDGGGTATYAYDGDGRRIKKTDSTGTTYFIYSITGQLLSEFSTTNTNASSASASDRLTYRTSEPTGTAVLLMASNGDVLENNRTLPYGELWTASIGSANQQKFTSYQRDDESGLDYAIHRYYASPNGRFHSSDPYAGSGQVMSSQSWHRYAYTANDPINSIDPLGLARRVVLPAGMFTLTEYDPFWASEHPRHVSFFRY